MTTDILLLCLSLTLPISYCHTGEEGGAESIVRIEKFLETSVEFHELDLLDKSGLEKLFEKVRRILGCEDNFP